MGSAVTTEANSRQGMREQVPNWTTRTQPEENLLQGCISDYSEGFKNTDANTVVRYSSDSYKTDAARWSNGFTQGKHVFEIVFPFRYRGTKATIGVGTPKQSLMMKGKKCLVGSTHHSWGIDLRTNRALHDGKLIKKYPSYNTRIANNIYMFLNVDAETLQFSSDREYYGTAFNEMKTNGLPLHPMVSATEVEAEISIIYRGSDPMSMPPAPPPTTTVERFPVAGNQPMTHPGMYRQTTVYTTPVTYMVPPAPVVFSTVYTVDPYPQQRTGPLPLMGPLPSMDMLPSTEPPPPMDFQPPYDDPPPIYSPIPLKT